MLKNSNTAVISKKKKFISSVVVSLFLLRGTDVVYYYTALVTFITLLVPTSDVYHVNLTTCILHTSSEGGAASSVSLKYCSSHAGKVKIDLFRDSENV